MPLNLELKIKLSSFEDVQIHLTKINAQSCGTLNQKDIYYDVPEGLLKLRIVNERQELIRYLRDEKNEERFSDYEVLEISTPGAEEFFNKIFTISAVVEKKRLLYMYDNTRIHLDEVKNLGQFLELETLVINGKEDAAHRFYKIVGLLHLDLSNQIKTSYKNLVEKINKTQPAFKPADQSALIKGG